MPVSLDPILHGRVCVVGIGNRLKGDDGAGPALIDLLTDQPGLTAIDAGVAPENYAEKIARTNPDTVLLVDAMDFSAAPGEVRVFKPTDLAPGGLSSHAGSLQMVADYLTARTHATIHIIGIQPASLVLGDGLSAAALSAVQSLADTLSRITDNE